MHKRQHKQKQIQRVVFVWENQDEWDEWQMTYELIRRMQIK